MTVDNRVSTIVVVSFAQRISTHTSQALYVAFGGRFGLEYFGKNNKPPRRSNAVYEEFYRTRNNEIYQGHQESYNSYGGSSRRSRHSSSWSDNGYSGGTMYPQSSSSYSGGYLYIIMVVGVSYFARSFFGIELLNMLPRRGYRRRFGGWGGRGWGGRNNVFGRNHFRHRPRGMWG